ncbi:hypothetical protein DBB36_02205 [Flavobacterium sp. WLB]|uniref:hypothetical protein n=1 Tax=unclassified Flavobacterium TaxID=196869 RepID=UPI0006ABA11A|nr:MULTISPECIES: hypothetical protein [unclassified Flavobacterium]KOP39212.1 hypothetical protein AKO67_06615 [Flavobacterium sp. VMW]OWU89126.1 hypothetical protein APR43_18140 [Flavobacterium sp. NLM]PUU71693.1 hypothetical protein DBB36_02205 [Flavobacterium sp. WLB]
MTKKLKYFVFSLLIILIVISCRSPKPIENENKVQTITITETLHDTVFKIAKDSSSYNALLDCINGKVVLKNVIQAEPGRTLKSPRVRLDNNKLSVDCDLKEQELYAFWKSKQVKDVQEKTITITKFVNYLTFWQKVQISLGRFFLIALIFLLLRFVYKIYKPLMV